VNFERLFARFASATAHATGRPITFILCVLVVIAWATTGPVFHYSETWQLVINTGTTIVTFLMVFLIQNTQNRDGAAIQTKLDQLILSSDAEDEFIGIERLTDKELLALHDRCRLAAEQHVKVSQRAANELHRRKKSPSAPRAGGGI
jgi:low affinity Fe/Cu permease